MKASAAISILWLQVLTLGVAQPVTAAPSPGQTVSQVRADRLDALYAWLRQARDGSEAETARRSVADLLARPLSPTAEALMQQVAMALDDGETAAAHGLLDQVILSYPDEPQAHLLRGRLLERLDRKDEALTAYDAALAREPRHIEALLAKGLLLRDLGRRDEALKAFKGALAIAPQLDEAKALVQEIEKLSRSL